MFQGYIVVDDSKFWFFGTDSEALETAHAFLKFGPKMVNLVSAETGLVVKSIAGGTGEFCVKYAELEKYIFDLARPFGLGPFVKDLVYEVLGWPPTSNYWSWLKACSGMSYYLNHSSEECESVKAAEAERRWRAYRTYQRDCPSRKDILARFLFTEEELEYD